MLMFFHDVVVAAVAEGQPLTNPGFVDNEFFRNKVRNPLPTKPKFWRSVFRKSEVSLNEAQVRTPEFDSRKKWSLQVRKLIEYFLASH